MHKLTVALLLTISISTVYRCDAYSNSFQNQPYIVDNTNNLSSSSPNVNQGVSNVSINGSWDTADDQKLKQSSSNTSQSFDSNKTGK